MDQETIRRELISTAGRRIKCCDELIRLAEAQQSILVDGRHSELADNLSSFDPLLIEFQQLDKREEALNRRLESCSADTTPGVQDEQYRKLSALMAEKAAALRSLTETNRRLLDNSMELVSYSVAVISKLAAEHQAKENPGTGTAIVLDRKV